MDFKTARAQEGVVKQILCARGEERREGGRERERCEDGSAYVEKG
jgi:hypothetical protein